jgi:isoleucyl-tRNA synthetase
MDQFKSEHEILQFWNSINAFETQLEKTKDYPEYIFYDGPPFATGLPHYGHLVASTLKDIIPRYMSQNGHHVSRKFGWDTHGLPIEFQMEKIHGIKTKKQVLEMGIDKYNEACRSIVLKYRDEWRKIINRLGRWVDFDNDYKTMDKFFMESVWWVFKQLFDKNLVYRGVKVMPYSTGCTTPLSNFEATSNYKSVTDPSLTLKFKVVDVVDIYLLVWTTTPWTLPSNLAICVNPNLTYLQVRSNKDQKCYIITETRLSIYFKDPDTYQIITKYTGKSLLGKKYQPLFPYFINKYGDKSFTILNDEYVEDNSGTGLVHIAPAFGKDDNRVCQENDIISKYSCPPCPLDENGCFTEEVVEYSGIYIKDADPKIIDHLKEQDLVFTIRKEKHEYPFCWRSNTPLIYKSVSSWFINVENIRDKIVENNKKTYWVPSNLRDNKFGNWIKNSIDWCVSRNRYWGTPIPIWASEDLEEIVCIGSSNELEELAGLSYGSITDLHRHHIDHITIPSKQGKGVLKRIEEVLDCWFESGSMPYAQNGYPYLHQDIDKVFPADFIAEGTDQTRGWFYTLMVISTGLFNKPAFKNLIVNGLVLASDGSKMSKSKNNYPPAGEILDKYGSDALRLYLIDSQIVKAGDLKFKENNIQGIVKSVNILMYNMTKYLLQMIDLYNSTNSQSFQLVDIINNPQYVTNSLDNWILQYVNNFIVNIHSEMKQYKLNNVVNNITILIDKLSRWYVKLNKNRISAGDEIALSVLYYSIYYSILTISPFVPFMSESIYQAIKHLDILNIEQSIHFIQMKPSIWKNDVTLLRPMEYFCEVINAARHIRTNIKNIALKIPVNELIVIHQDTQLLSKLDKLKEYLLYELNLMNIVFSDQEQQFIDYKLRVNKKKLGRKYGKEINNVDKFIQNISGEEAKQIVINTRNICYQKDIIKFEDVLIDREVSQKYHTYHFYNKDDITLLMDTKFTEEMEYKHQAKLLIRYAQDLRKEAGLVPANNIKIYYKILENNDTNKLDIFFSQKQEEYIHEQIRNKILPYDESINYFIDKQFDIFNSKIKIYFHK